MLEDLGELLVHFLSECALAVRSRDDKVVSVLHDELLENVAVYVVYWQDLRQQELDFVLHTVFRVDERCQLLGKVNRLVNRHLDCLVLIFLEKISQGRDDCLARVFEFVAEAQGRFVVL